MSDMKLQVMICTHGAAGLRRVASMMLPRVDGVGYLVSCQCEPMDLPPKLQRDDVDVFFTPSKGLSNNRNHALSLVTAPYALVADDDLVYSAPALRRVIEIFDADASLDIATFRCQFPYPRQFPPFEWPLERPFKCYNPVSVEIAVRTASVRARGLRFSPLMGIGAPYLQAGEECVFLLACLRSGLRGRFYPEVIARHPQPSTGVHSASSPGTLRANGAYILLAHPLTMALRIPLVARRTKGGTLRNMWHLACGAWFALRNRKKLLFP